MYQDIFPLKSCPLPPAPMKSVPGELPLDFLPPGNNPWIIPPWKTTSRRIAIFEIPPWQLRPRNIASWTFTPE